LTEKTKQEFVGSTQRGRMATDSCLDHGAGSDFARPPAAEYLTVPQAAGPSGADVSTTLR
jgi:hypothetical protein